MKNMAIVNTSLVRLWSNSLRPDEEVGGRKSVELVARLP